LELDKFNREENEEYLNGRIEEEIERANRLQERNEQLER